MKAREDILETHHELLREGLRSTFGTLDAAMFQLLLPLVQWVELNAGDVLFEQNSTDESIYFVVSGRLRAGTRGLDGVVRSLGDIARGETIGEMAFFTGEARMATVTAVRDSILAHFSKQAFQTLLEAYPSISLSMMRLVIGRHKRSSLSQKPVSKSVSLGLAAITGGLDLGRLVAQLERSLAPFGPTKVVTSADIEAKLGSEPSVAGVSRLLDRFEAEFPVVLLVADSTPSLWTARCLRHCDDVLLFADADAAPALHPIEIEALANQAGRESQITRHLVLLHPDDRLTPLGTRLWLKDRPVDHHVHVRRGNVKDWNRLARVVSGRAIGLVLAGGGARGLAHLGVMKALQNEGIEFDLVGGTSIGAVMAALAAMDLTADQMIAQGARAFGTNPTGDLNWLPLYSLMKGKRLKQAIDSAIFESRGQQIDVEDLWKGFFCISSNYSAASESILDSGPLGRMVRASVSIPGALPPVVLGGDLHVDGGAFNNFPVDVMYRRGAAVVIGVSLPREVTPKIELDEVPSLWQTLVGAFRGLKSELPSLTTVLFNAAMINSLARQSQARGQIDLWFQPPVLEFDILDWKRFDELVANGLAHGQEVLAGLSEPLRRKLQGQSIGDAKAVDR
ncbi:MAG: patatin-like phospholipase family protein [Spirochaetales bacterium]